jgi:hypothetical protein
VFAVDRFLKGESKSIATMPMLKICTPPPDMYSMNACIGSDLTGEMANSQAFFVFRASCELSASAAAAVADADGLPDPLPYNWKEWGGVNFLRRFAFSSRPPCVSDAPLILRENLAEEEACSICAPIGWLKERWRRNWTTAYFGFEGSRDAKSSGVTVAGEDMYGDNKRPV